MKRGTIILLIVAAALLFVILPLTVLIGAFLSGASGDGLPGLGTGIGYMTVEGTIADSRATIRDLKSLEKNPLVKAILIRVESPGGGVTPSHEIYSEIVRVRTAGTPVVVSLGSIATSGGYYIAAPADLIVANPGTITGSIGVIMQFPALERMRSD